ncbi:SAM-dependent methyltransferase [Tunturiibacter empetritectus]|uniref:SAM-dependent methyltransferase n=2 Tax=Tunturiibacter TaxID=3154218 RepID=A0A852VE70_9BACT|nr:SAM-dependent methyltransferase [Edaphobacter lichenicola]
MSVDTKFESSPDFFEAKYRENADPWDFSRSAYELRRYDSIINAISHRTYRRAFEPGCSIGVLTERLAAYCDAVDAIDFSPSASMQAQRRCAHLPNVEVRCAALPDGVPVKDFDLLVLSEIGYYFSPQTWQQITSTFVDSIPQGATVLAAHWLGHSQDHYISGDEVHEILLAHPGLLVEHSERNQNMRLDRLVRL